MYRMSNMEMVDFRQLLSEWLHNYTLFLLNIFQHLCLKCGGKIHTYNSKIFYKIHYFHSEHPVDVHIVLWAIHSTFIPLLCLMERCNEFTHIIRTCIVFLPIYFMEFLCKNCFVFLHKIGNFIITVLFFKNLYFHV